MIKYLKILLVNTRAFKFDTNVVVSVTLDVISGSS